MAQKAPGKGRPSLLENRVLDETCDDNLCAERWVVAVTCPLGSSSDRGSYLSSMRLVLA